VPTPDYRVQEKDTLLIGLHEAVEKFLALD
jgi:hypothetical protein